MIKNILMTAPVTIGDTHLDGQVLVICTNEFNSTAPSKKNRNFRLNFPVFIDKDDAPEGSKDTVNWLLPKGLAPGAKLRAAYIILEFDPDTMPMPTEEVPDASREEQPTV